MSPTISSLARLTLRQLRQIASDLGVPLYSRKSKESLVDEVAVRQALSRFGEIESCDLTVESWYGVVRFTTHATALDVKRSAAAFAHVAGAIDTLYNERSYDGRRGVDGLDDRGRGWCCFEGAVSTWMPSQNSRIPPLLVC